MGAEVEVESPGAREKDKGEGGGARGRNQLKIVFSSLLISDIIHFPGAASYGFHSIPHIKHIILLKFPLQPSALFLFRILEADFQFSLHLSNHNKVPASDDSFSCSEQPIPHLEIQGLLLAKNLKALTGTTVSIQKFK